MATMAFVSLQAVDLLFLFLLPSRSSPALPSSTIHSCPRIRASTPCTAYTTILTSTLFLEPWLGMPNHGVVLLFPTGVVQLNLHWSRPSLSVIIRRGIVATNSRPLVSRGSIVCLNSFAVSLQDISLHTGTSKLIMVVSFNSTDIDAPN